MKVCGDDTHYIINLLMINQMAKKLEEYSLLEMLGLFLLEPERLESIRNLNYYDKEMQSVITELHRIYCECSNYFQPEMEHVYEDEDIDKDEDEEIPAKKSKLELIKKLISKVGGADVQSIQKLFESVDPDEIKRIHENTLDHKQKKRNKELLDNYLALNNKSYVEIIEICLERGDPIDRIII
ncbi:hypothetical protein TKK_0011672 [Trichogramma kaykai]